ncbi:MAG: FAD-binding protein [Actinobacteria bacterium]|nr:FAD-binding protein [Actinomycetota bacterium]
MRPTLTAIERDLRGLLRGDVEFDAVTRHLYATDGGIYQIEPMGVVSPFDAEDVARLVAYCTERGVPLVPRGAGSGLAGAAVGAGLMVDFTRYMNKILEVAPDGSWARVQPGLVMGVLNAHVKRYGTFFAPNPSSENYCSLGGMIANNSSGGRSVAYGGTKDHVLALDVVLSGGELFHAGPVTRGSDALAAVLGSGGRAGAAFADLLPLLDRKRGAVATSMPRVMKNCSGYRVETVLEWGADAPGYGAYDGAAALAAADAEWTRANLQKLFVGSEGTLGLVTEATLNLVPLPGRRAIGMAYFPTVFSAGEAVHPILALKPSSLEIMDANFLRFVRESNSKIDAMLPKVVDTALLVEFEAADDAELEEKLASLEGLLAGGDALEVKRALDPGDQKQLWAVRQAAVPLLQKLPGPKKIVEFIEDATVHPEVLADYMSRLNTILQSHDVRAIMYGHAGDGNIHTRPILDMRNPGDLRLMNEIMEEVMEVILDLKATPSGEHGDGIVRSPYVRRVYGDEVYGIFERIKEAFDPTGIMNPGKKVVNPAETGGIATNLRYGRDYWTHEQSTQLHFPGGEYEREIEKCHGCAQCKSMVATTMCPTYKATRREHASPRAKANALRNIISGRLDPGLHTGAALKEVTDYCIECGMCALECPSNVNIPKLMLEAKAKYRTAHAGGPTDQVLGRAELVSKVSRAASPVVNPLAANRVVRRLGERLAGIDHRRTLPAYARKSWEQMLAERRKGAVNPHPVPEPGAGTEAVGVAGNPGGSGGSSAGDSAAPAVAAPAAAPAAAKPVAFFYDVYANYNDPGLAQTFDSLLRAHGVPVVYPEQKGSAVPEMLYGYMDRARATAEFNVRHALPHVRDGAYVVSGEPTASFAFKVHYPDIVSSEDCSLVANATRDLGEFLVSRRTERPEAAPRPVADIKLKIAYHQPCHLKTQQVGSPFFDLLEEVPGLELVNLDAGCCGMAGTFGMKAGTFDLSMETGRPLFERVTDVSPDLVASECSTCRMQLAQATGKDTVHPAELLARAYGI